MQGGLWRGDSHLQAVNQNLPLIKDAAHACQQVIPRCQHSLLLWRRQGNSALHHASLGEIADKVCSLLLLASQSQSLRHLPLSIWQLSQNKSPFLVALQLRSTLHGSMVSSQDGASTQASRLTIISLLITCS